MNGHANLSGGRGETNGTPASDSPANTHHAAQTQAAQIARVRTIATAAIAGAGFGLLVAIGVLAIRNRGRLPELTPADFYAAERQWEREGPASYDVTIEVTGRQAATYHVEVRDNEVQVATRNGAPLKQQRTMGTWSVPGMFGTMRSDVENLERRLAGTADADTPQVRLRASFDPQFGYPARYHRAESTRGQNHQDVTWEVTSFVIRQ